MTFDYYAQMVTLGMSTAFSITVPILLIGFIWSLRHLFN
jgi:hypothetical protein